MEVLRDGYFRAESNAEYYIAMMRIQVGWNCDKIIEEIKTSHGCALDGVFDKEWIQWFYDNKARDFTIEEGEGDAEERTLFVVNPDNPTERYYTRDPQEAINTLVRSCKYNTDVLPTNRGVANLFFSPLRFWYTMEFVKKRSRNQYQLRSRVHRDFDGVFVVPPQGGDYYPVKNYMPRLDPDRIIRGPFIFRHDGNDHPSADYERRFREAWGEPSISGLTAIQGEKVPKRFLFDPLVVSVKYYCDYLKWSRNTAAYKEANRFNAQKRTIELMDVWHHRTEFLSPFFQMHERLTVVGKSTNYANTLNAIRGLIPEAYKNCKKNMMSDSFGRYMELAIARAGGISDVSLNKRLNDGERNRRLDFIWDVSRTLYEIPVRSFDLDHAKAVVLHVAVIAGMDSSMLDASKINTLLVQSTYNVPNLNALPPFYLMRAGLEPHLNTLFSIGGILGNEYFLSSVLDILEGTILDAMGNDIKVRVIEDSNALIPRLCRGHYMNSLDETFFSGLPGDEDVSQSEYFSLPRSYFMNRGLTSVPRFDQDSFPKDERITRFSRHKRNKKQSEAPTEKTPTEPPAGDARRVEHRKSEMGRVLRSFIWEFAAYGVDEREFDAKVMTDIDRLFGPPRASSKEKQRARVIPPVLPAADPAILERPRGERSLGGKRPRSPDGADQHALPDGRSTFYNPYSQTVRTRGGSQSYYIPVNPHSRSVSATPSTPGDPSNSPAGIDPDHILRVLEETGRQTSEPPSRPSLNLDRLLKKTREQNYDDWKRGGFRREGGPQRNGGAQTRPQKYGTADPIDRDVVPPIRTINPGAQRRTHEIIEDLEGLPDIPVRLSPHLRGETSIDPENLWTQPSPRQSQPGFEDDFTLDLRNLGEQPNPGRTPGRVERGGRAAGSPEQAPDPGFVERLENFLGGPSTVERQDPSELNPFIRPGGSDPDQSLDKFIDDLFGGV